MPPRARRCGCLDGGRPAEESGLLAKNPWNLVNGGEDASMVANTYAQITPLRSYLLAHEKS